MKRRLDIFRTGTHTAMGGQNLEFSDSDLQATVAAYDPKKHEAPLVVGHPSVEAPAYGWVQALSFADGVLVAQPAQVDPEFAEAVNAGRFKKISASFYLPDAPHNPVPGVYYLRHVGFLGAQAPAVKGLKSASFAANEAGVIEFGDWADRVEAGLFRRLREWIIGKFGLEEAEKALPGWDVDAVQENAAQIDLKPEDEPVFGEGPQPQQQEGDMPTKDELAAKEAALKEKEVSFAEREANLERKEKAARNVEHVAFAEGLVQAGKLLPIQKEQVVAMLDVAAYMAKESVVEFGEGEGKKSVSMADALKTFLTAQPKIVEFREVAKKEGDSEEGQPAEVIAQKAVEFQESEAKSGRTISITDAVNHVTKKGGK